MAVGCGSGQLGGGVVDEGADGVALGDLGDVARGVVVEDDDGHAVFAGEGEGGGVHDGEALADGVFVIEGGVALGVGVDVGVFGVDAIDFGGFEDGVAVKFDGSEDGGGVGGEEWVADAAAEDDDGALFEELSRVCGVVGLDVAVEAEGGEGDGGDVVVVEGGGDGDGVDDGAEHAHDIGVGSLDDAGGGEGGASDDVSATGDDGEFGAGVEGLFDFLGESEELFLCDARAGAIGGEGFACDFEEGAFEGLAVVVWHLGGFLRVWGGCCGWNMGWWVVWLAAWRARSWCAPESAMDSTGTRAIRQSWRGCPILGGNFGERSHPLGV